MLLKPSNDSARPYSFELPRILAINLAYLPTLQQSDVLVFNQTQVAVFYFWKGSNLFSILIVIF